MAYVTVADWAANRYPAQELIQLTDTLSVGIADPSVFAQAESQAASIIDGYLSAAYAVPLTGTVPPAIKLIALDLTRWVLHKQGAPDDVILKKEEALARLRDYAKGISTLSGASPRGQSGGIAYTTVTATFTTDPGPA